MNGQSMSLGDVASFDPTPMLKGWWDTKVLAAFVPMSSMSAETGSIVPAGTRSVSELLKGYTYFQSGDVLVAKITPCFENGKIGQAIFTEDHAFGSTEFHVVRANPSQIDSRYLHHFLRTPGVRSSGELRMTGSAGQRRVPRAFLQDLKIPVPALSEQRRIAAILDKAEALRTKRREALTHLESMASSYFKHAAAQENNSRTKTVKLGDIASFVGGGTPARAVPSYFSGSICWATSKDMKGENLYDTQEHVTETAIKESSAKLVPAGSVLVVVKSKVLMNRLPVLTARVPTCFGQDLKGIIPLHGWPASFIARTLRVQQQNLLSQARGINTEGLTLHHLRSFELPNLNKGQLLNFDQFEIVLMQQRSKLLRSQLKEDRLFASLQHRAFRGEL